MRILVSSFLILILCAGSVSAIISSGQNGKMAIIPEPVSVKVLSGNFKLSSGTVILADKETMAVAQQLALQLATATGRQFEVKSPGNTSDNCIILRIDSGMRSMGDEGYRLNVTEKGIIILAPKPAGAFYACQSLLQLLPPQIVRKAKVEGIKWSVPCVQIEDYPRFPWRGGMLDVSRHFMPKEFVMKYIDLLSQYKMNVFHWHLTDDQGWRIEIKQYPKLTEVGAWRKESQISGGRDDAQFDRKPHGGFYTQDDIREVVEYARQRHVTIVPEIDMPAHVQSAIAAYPELGNTGKQLPVYTLWPVSFNILNANESTIVFFQNVLSEVLYLFPGKYIHIGGDEAVRTQWKESPDAQSRIKDLGLKDEKELQSYFIHRMDQFLTSKGRRLVGWDEILEGGLAPGATVMSWQGIQGGIAAAKAGHDVVMTPWPYTYFDHPYSGTEAQQPLPMEKVYNYEPIPSELTKEEARYVLGSQGQIWTEGMVDPKRVEYMAFPRLIALAENVWTQGNKKNYSDFVNRLQMNLERLRIQDVNFRALDEDRNNGEYEK